MKIIDLLNKIANGEEVPANIKYNGIDYYWCNSCKIYERIEDGRNDLYNDIDNLNDEVEILEEKKIPEKIEREIHIENGVEISSEPSIEQIMDKFNQLIDYLKSKGE